MGMKKTPTAWAIQRPDKMILTSMIRPTRREAILAISSHFRPQEARNPWLVLYKRGFQAIRVSIYPKVMLQ